MEQLNTQYLRVIFKNPYYLWLLLLFYIWMHLLHIRIVVITYPNILFKTHCRLLFIAPKMCHIIKYFLFKYLFMY